jgi:hypothetical protein
MAEEPKKREIKLVSTVSLKINVGNFETLEVMKSVEADVDFSSQEELCQKSSTLDRIVATLVKNAADHQCADMARNRYFKLGGHEIPVPLWVDGKAEALEKIG